jgi:hypothetical protein
LHGAVLLPASAPWATILGASASDNSYHVNHGASAPALASPMFVPPELQRARKRKYDADGCHALFLEFSELAKDISEFGKAADWE